MKVINNRYFLLEKLEDRRHESVYSAKDLFKNKKVLVRIFDFENVTTLEFDIVNEKYELATLIEHPGLLSYYNFEKIWFVDEKKTYTNYYILASDYIPLLRIHHYAFAEERDLLAIIFRVAGIVYYLHKNSICVHACDTDAFFINNDGDVVCDLMRLNADRMGFDADTCTEVYHAIAGLIQTIAGQSARVAVLRDMVRSHTGSFEELFVLLNNECEIGNSPFSYLAEKKIWTTHELGISTELDVMNELFDFHIKRNSLIAFVLYGSDNSFKTFVINDFLNGMKRRKYLKLEIIMQNFYDFLKYLFDCVKHYSLVPKAIIESAEHDFERYREISDEQILFSVQSTVAEILFNLSITKPVVFHVKSIVGMDDHIIKFINMLLHMEASGNIVLVFDAGLEKNRFGMFYKNSRFEIVSKEYFPLSDAHIADLFHAILTHHTDISDLLQCVQGYRLNQAGALINFIQKIFDKGYLEIVDNKALVDTHNIEFEKNEILVDDALKNHLKFLREEEKNILWFIANNGNYLTLEQLTMLFDIPQDNLLDYLGSLRIHAFIDEIWDKNTASYRIVRKSINEYFIQLDDFAFVSPLRKRLIRFMTQAQRDSASLVTVVKLLFTNHYYFSAMKYLMYLVEVYSLSQAEYEQLKYYAHTLLGLPKRFSEKWRIKHVYMDILFQLGETKELWMFLERIAVPYCAHADMVQDDNVWFYLAERYMGFYDREHHAHTRVQQIISILKKKTPQTGDRMNLIIALQFMDAKAQKKYEIADTFLAKIEEEYSDVIIEARLKLQVVTYLNARVRYTEVYACAERCIESWEKKLTHYPGLMNSFIVLYITAGYAVMATGDYNQGKRLYERGMFWAKKHHDNVRMITLHNNIASAKYYLGYPESEIVEELKMAVSIGRKIGAMKKILVALSNVGETYCSNLLFTDAYKYLIEAVKYVRIHDGSNYFVVMGQFAALLIALGDFKRARHICRLMGKFSKKSGNVQNELDYYRHMALLYYFERNNAKAIRFCDLHAALAEESNLFNYHYFAIALKKTDILVNRLGKKTEAKRLLDSLIVLQKSKNIVLGDLQFDLYRSYFENDPEVRAEILEKLVIYYKKQKQNTLLLDVLLELVKIYQKKEFLYRLFEIYAEILEFSKHIKENYPRQFIHALKQNYYLSEIEKFQTTCADTLDVKPHEITAKYLNELWRKNMTDYMLKFYRKRMAALIQEWHSENSNSTVLIRVMLEYICEIAKADRVILFVQHAKDGLVPHSEYIKRDVFAANEIKKDILSLIRYPAVLVAREYSTFSTSIVNAGVYPVMQYDSGQFAASTQQQVAIHENIAAYIYLDSKKICTNISADLGNFIFIFAQYLSLFLHQRELQQDIAVCPLTKILTRTYFLIELNKLIHHRKRDESLGFMIIDIDTMKDINGVYGMNAGDSIIARVAAIIKEYIGDTGLIGRYLGEEFAIVLWQISKDRLLEKAHRLKRLIENDREVRQKNITVSIGLSYLPDHGENIDILLNKAIAAGYYAKKEDPAQRIDMWQEHYRLYRGLHDALAGIVSGDIAHNESIIRSFVELTLYSSQSNEEYGAYVVSLIGQALTHDYHTIMMRIGTEKYLYHDDEILMIDSYFEAARKENNVIIAINWKYEEKGMGLYSDIIYAYSDAMIGFEVYLTSKMERKEFLPADMNVLTIIAKIVLGHLALRSNTQVRLD